MWLRLYRGAADAEPLTEIELDPSRNHTFAFWHLRVGGAQPGWFYTWRADGPHDPPAGLRFDASRELLDPWARLVSDGGCNARRRPAANRPRSARRSVGPTSTAGMEASRWPARCRRPWFTRCTLAAS